MGLIKVRYPDSTSFNRVWDWCKGNCTGKWYPGTDWDNWNMGERNCMVEFELESDATMFALVWV